MKEKMNQMRCWAISQGGDFANNLMRDFKSIKALWNYLFLALYTWVIVWCVLYHADACGTAAIYTTGGVVTAIFTNYVWSAHAEKKAANQFPAYIPPTPPAGAATTEDDGNG